MKEDIFFNVGYSTYLQKGKSKKTRWTSKIFKTVLEHKFISISVSVIVLCVIMNFYLIHQFISILEQMA